MLKHKKGVEFTLFGQVLIELLQDVLDKELPFRFVNFCLSWHVNTYLEAEELEMPVVKICEVVHAGAEMVIEDRIEK